MRAIKSHAHTKLVMFDVALSDFRSKDLLPQQYALSILVLEHLVD